ncbi:MAG: 30S ribosomal protein S10 [Candidatus Micrarchaeaceae archaeon]
MIAKVKLYSNEKGTVNRVAGKIIEISKANGIKCKGPVPLPTERHIVSTRRTPCGDGSDTRDRWEMRIHKMIVILEGNDQAMRQIMRVPVPDTVKIEVLLS